MNPTQLERILEAALMVVNKPLNINQLQKLFPENEVPATNEIQEALHNIKQHYENRGIELLEVASGYRFQAKSDLSQWLARLWEERAPRYSRAFLETLAIIAYQQPLTRAEIESIRGVAVSSPIIKSLLEREWVRIVGYREIPGKPALYATTKEFLDYFNLKNLSELPTLAELKDLDAQYANLQVQMAIEGEGKTIGEREEELEQMLDKMEESAQIEREEIQTTHTEEELSDKVE